ncbi:prolyl oligopeptidase family serine peptidase [Microbacterium sp. F2]|uniref:prolyl oligopeptidase family serine peptidase n=1 Tax=Microbacterium sp. F2 TaxID=3422228 RepID=UPI003FD52897
MDSSLPRLPYGTWPSPISATSVAAASPRFEGAAFVAAPDGEEIWWGQSAPAEGGRTTVRRRLADGTVEELLPAPWNARSRVHEYGGGAWAATDDGGLCFVEKTDQRIWILDPGSEPRALTPVGTRMRFGGLRFAAGELWAIREDHTRPGVPARDMVRVPRDGSAANDADQIVSVVAGSDFVAHPAVSPDGSQLAWIAWNHPAMPWDSTELRLGSLVDGRIQTWQAITGGPDRAPLQPEWADNDRLFFLDDPEDRWNLHTWSASHGPRCVAAVPEDTGGPLWSLGGRWYSLTTDGTAVCVSTHGTDRIIAIAPDGEIRNLGGPVSSGASVEDAAGERALVIGSRSDGAAGVWLVDAATAQWETVAGGEKTWPAEWTPHPIELTTEGPRGEVHAFAFPPTNPTASAPEDELPPYVVLVHGGPTGHVGGAASPKIAYFASRGIGVLDVNYGGSSGYGRAYRERLRGQWGVVDVEDVRDAALALGDAGLADPARIAIDGGSAGGWTVLAAIARTDMFAAGVSRYGVGDARALAADTHDFEARYLDGLIGPLPEAEHLYLERSPLSHPEGFDVPMLLLQGAEDEVVPPAQAEAIREALAARGIPHAYVLYEGEAHGFRRAETVIHALETELAFLGAVFGFTPPGVAPLTLS